jgi:hypothetical protein
MEPPGAQALWRRASWKESLELVRGGGGLLPVERLPPGYAAQRPTLAVWLRYGVMSSVADAALETMRQPAPVLVLVGFSDSIPVHGPGGQRRALDFPTPQGIRHRPLLAEGGTGTRSGGCGATSACHGTPGTRQGARPSCRDTGLAFHLHWTAV